MDQRLLDDQIVALVRQDVLPQEVCQRLGVSVHRLRKAMGRLGVRYSPAARSAIARRRAEAVSPRRPDLAERILELQRAGRKRADIAAEVGASLDSVNSVLSGTRLTAAQRAAQHQVYSPELRQRAEALRRDGRPLREISTVLEVSDSTARYLCASVKLTPEQCAANKRRHPRVVDDEVARLKATGMRRTEIASTLGVPLSKVKTVINHRGLGDPGASTLYTWEDARAVCAEFGLTPLNYPETGKVSDTQSHAWRVRCRCGREFAPQLNSVVCRRVRSCGCVHSHAEAELAAWVQDLGLEAYRDRQVIAPYEIDVYVPSLKVGVEYNGLHWHGEKLEGTRGRDSKTYRKWVLARKAGVRLVTVFEDEWLERQDQVKGYLRAILRAPLERVGARECALRRTSEGVAQFLDQNHIQGAARGDSYVLLAAGSVVAAAVFAAPNASRNAKGDRRRGATVELVRYCVRAGCAVPGGAARLLRAFLRDHQEVEYVVSYSDNRWSDGALYRALGFELEREGDPSYWYVRDGSSGPREHRYRWRKQVCRAKFDCDDAATEWEIMSSHGYDRVWDCGSRRWVLRVSKPAT